MATPLQPSEPTTTITVTPTYPPHTHGYPDSTLIPDTTLMTGTTLLPDMTIFPYITLITGTRTTSPPSSRRI
jgi:hypothetical protein